MTQLVDTNTVAERLGIHPNTVREYARDGVLPALRVGGTWRFDLEEVEEAARVAAAEAGPETE